MLKYIKKILNIEVAYSTKGISYYGDKLKQDGTGKPWKAYLQTVSGYIHIGYYNTREEAVIARYNFIKSLI